MAQFLSLAAFRQGKQGAQHRLQGRILKGFREIGSRRPFNRTQQVKTRIAKMRQQQTNAGGRERGREQTALTPPIGAFREENP
jgi:hypothetical protein